MDEAPAPFSHQCRVPAVFQWEMVRKALRAAKDYADRHPLQPKLITINSWNEWTESSYLEPDDLHGYGYLEAVRRVFKDAK